MKFRFCGKSDCPDWIQAIITILSKLSSVKLKLLTQIVVDGIIDPPLNLEKAVKLFSESKLDSNLDLKACISCLRYIVISTIRFACETTALQTELQQLGLPREHSLAIKKVLDTKQDLIVEILEKTSLKVDPFEALSVEVYKESNCAVLNITVDGKTNQVTMMEHTIDVLLKNLRELKPKMEELNAYKFKTT
ncbi:hypothetical protein WA026_004379 [Henosepilachna vigintioctopunctata]|uniref:COMM domain-containing protein 4 n=1 Tax=Henosepilachna vigintioctopunctata TaxID=420089 RepID=A0AAW1V0C5_9CUCU